MGYTKQAIKGVTWIGLLRVVNRFFAFVRIAILARLFTPYQFGTVSIALLVLSFVEIITETGINVFLVQEDRQINKYINTAWIVSIVRGIIISLIMIVSAPLISSFFNSPDSQTLIFLLSIVPLVRGCINPSIIFFQKELQFNKEFYFRSFLFFIDALVSIIFAFITKNPVSIMYGVIAAALFEVILSFAIVKPIPAFSFSTNQLKEIIKRGKWITGASFFSYLFQNLDDIAVGRILGTGAIGLYDVAYRISMLPITEIADVLSKVTFPVYVKISGDVSRLKKAFYKTILITFVLVIPLGLAFILFPELIIRVLLGDTWVEAAPVLRVLAVVGMIKALVGSTTALFFAIKKQEYVNWILLVSVVGLLAGLPLIYSSGIVGAALASVVGVVVSIPLALYYISRVFRK